MKILLAVDGSPYSLATTEAIIAHMAPANNQVRVLHAVEPLFVMYDAPDAASKIEKLEQKRMADGKEIVERFAALLGAAGFEVATEVEEGEPRRAIIEAAAEWGADLIVVGSHGHGGVGRFLLGSVSDAVARHARCSVEIIRVAASGKSAEGQAGLAHQQKCAHPPCTCIAQSGRYCSAQCEAMSQTPDIDCRCGHPACKGRAH